MNKLTRIQLILLGILILVSSANAQPFQLSLEDCYTLARANYPIIKKLDLISKSADYSIANASKFFLPQINLSGQATYQSQTISFADALGGMPGGPNLPNISKDQYKIQAEISQTIYDGGHVNNQRAYIRANQVVQQQNIEVALYAINDRINQIFFSILLMNEQLRQNEIRKIDLEGATEKTKAALKFGTAFRSNLDQLNAELINSDMTAIELKSNRDGYLNVLATFVGKELTDSNVLTTPGTISPGKNINRPEIKLFDFQKTLFDVEEKKLKTEIMPKLGAFAQGAYGRPTLNFVSNKFGAWYLVGARLNWNIASLYTLKNNLQNLAISRKSLDLDQETFLLNTNLALHQQDGDINKFSQLIAKDYKVVELRASVKKAALAQLENGVITAHDYISQLNAENQARQMLIFHNIQLLQATYKQKYISGN